MIDEKDKVLMQRMAEVYDKAVERNTGIIAGSTAQERAELYAAVDPEALDGPRAVAVMRLIALLSSEDLMAEAYRAIEEYRA